MVRDHIIARPWQGFADLPRHDAATRTADLEWTRRTSNQSEVRSWRYCLRVTEPARNVFHHISAPGASARCDVLVSVIVVQHAATPIERHRSQMYLLVMRTIQHDEARCRVRTGTASSFAVPARRTPPRTRDRAAHRRRSRRRPDKACEDARVRRDRRRPGRGLLERIGKYCLLASHVEVQVERCETRGAGHV
jgi:hypothetical protein